MPPVRRLLPVCFLLGGASLISGNMSNKYPPFGDCLPFMEYKNAKSQLQWRRGKMGVFITCNTNYTLSGSNFMEVYCLEGRWRLEIGVSPSKCERHCMAPPPLDKGMLDPKSYSPNGTYLDGSTVYYLCNKEFYQNIRPAYLVCEAGIWTGPVIHCLYAGPSWCYPPEIIPHGYHIAPRIHRQVFQIDEQINYGCKKRYHLVGADTITCTSTGEWHPPPPSCLLKSDLVPISQCSCRPLLDPKIHHKVEIVSITDKSVEIGCPYDYQNTANPCKTSTFYCKDCNWVGLYPNCVQVNTCVSPPKFPHSQPMLPERKVNLGFPEYKEKLPPLVPIRTQLFYKCSEDYIQIGHSSITCKPNGCWEVDGGWLLGDRWPTCIPVEEYNVKLDHFKSILVPGVTGFGVLGLLTLACVVVACRRKRALAEPVALPTSVGRVRNAPHLVNDHTVLLQHADRLALIAFAEGVQNNQSNGLPSYDEAIRDNRSTLIQVSRLQIQRPYWPNLTVCRTSGRSRNSPNIDPAHHVPRHGSCASHTPSMRSGGEWMGSTETVTISEGSTNVTLDTASSHSATSQNPSCRGHCGSLASFDACSIVNIEGIPLLEENELEETQGGLGVDADMSNSDHSSCKSSTHSAPMLAN